MNPTTIEWVLNPDGSPGFTSNPFTGCLGPKGDGINCPYCYAKTLAHGRLKTLYLANEEYAPVDIYNLDMIDPADDPFYPRFWKERLKDLYVKSPKGIFVCDMSDWAAPWLPMAWKEDLMAAIRKNPQHRIYLLTHQPQELQKWSPYPDNCWVGATATTASAAVLACYALEDIKATLKYLSIEPLLAWVLSSEGSADPAMFQELKSAGINWLIIGAMTGRMRELMQLSNRHYPKLTLMPYGKIWTLQPKVKWVKEIVDAADKARIPVFLKDNLEPLIYGQPSDFDDTWATTGNYKLRQELPSG